MTPRRYRRKARPSRPAESSAQLMPGLFRWLKLDEGARGFAAQRAFDQAAGPRVRSRARAEKLRGSTLFVRVASAAWSHELHALKAELLGKLKQTPGGEGVSELRFSVGSLDELPSWEAEPGERLAETDKPFDVVESAPPAAEVQAALSEVVDAELRIALKQLFVRQRR